MDVRLATGGCALLWALASAASAADIVLTPPPSGGVSVTNAASDAVRFRVGEDGVVTLPGVGSAATSAAPLCIESTTGKLGTCTTGATSSTPAAKWLLKIPNVTAAAGEEVSVVSWGASRQSTGSPNLGDVVLSQAARNPSLVKLIQNVFTGFHTASVVVEYYAPPDTLAMQFTLTDVVGTYVTTNGTTSTQQSNTLQFKYGTITIVDVATGTRTCWNVSTNVAC